MAPYLYKPNERFNLHLRWLSKNIRMHQAQQISGVLTNNFLKQTFPQGESALREDEKR